MDKATVISLAEATLTLVLLVSLPPIIVATVVGLAISLFQALTQIQEQTLSFAVKLIAVIATLVFFGGWLTAELLTFSQNVFADFPRLIR